jgi:uncharacterized membrane protein required for colicin V production
MELQPADYVLCALTVVSAVLGLFRGFSGTLAFVVAVAAGGVAASLSWMYSVQFVQAAWMRALATLLVALLAFGIVRIIVKKLVNGLLAQPTDAIFGLLVGASVGFAAVAGWAWSGMFLEYSNLASALAVWVR